MENYFNIRYEFDKRAVLQAIDEALLLGKPGYICVSDGVILSTVNRDPDYRQVVDGAMFSICDSGYVPLYLLINISCLGAPNAIQIISAPSFSNISAIAG